MTQPLISILLPHLRNPSNDAALKVCLDCIVANTGLNYHLDVEAVAERRDIYAVLNRMVERAPTAWVVPFNSDTFAAPGWLETMWAARHPSLIVSPVMVECGAIPVNDLNLERDFGRMPQTFRRSEFEAWAISGGSWRDDWNENGRAWYFPSLLNRDAFLATGGFDTSRGVFPQELDMWFWDAWAARGGTFKRVRSFIYHLQAYNEPGRGVRA